MPEKKLIETLKQLHDEITHTESVDKETRELLQVAATDVLELLARSDRSDADHESIKSRLNDMLARSEVEHPALVGLLRQVADGLANLGI